MSGTTRPQTEWGIVEIRLRGACRANPRDFTLAAGVLGGVSSEAREEAAVTARSAGSTMPIIGTVATTYNADVCRPHR